MADLPDELVAPRGASVSRQGPWPASMWRPTEETVSGSHFVQGRARSRDRPIQVSDSIVWPSAPRRSRPTAFHAHPTAGLEAGRCWQSPLGGLNRRPPRPDQHLLAEGPVRQAQIKRHEAWRQVGQRLLTVNGRRRGSTRSAGTPGAIRRPVSKIWMKTRRCVWASKNPAA